MDIENQDALKSQVQEFWNNSACGTFLTKEDKYSKEYFEDIEQTRYRMQPEIFSFAQFTRFNGKKFLEVGVGAGTDFLQWVRAGVIAYGIDLTQEAVDHVVNRLELYGLKAEKIIPGDCENLPFEDNSFDIIYSWGVIHHTPNTEKALHEIIRVCKPGGRCKIMIYHRHSILAYLFWVKHALLKLKPWKSVSSVLWNHMESIGTKAYTKKEVEKMLFNQPIDNINIKPILSYYDRLERFNKPMQFIAKILSIIFGQNRVGWELTIEFDKKV